MHITTNTTVGNCFGYSGKVKVPEGKWAVVENDEYADGGYGPIIIGKVYDSEADARIAMSEIEADLLVKK